MTASTAFTGDLSFTSARTTSATSFEAIGALSRRTTSRPFASGSLPGALGDSHFMPA